MDRRRLLALAAACAAVAPLAVARAEPERRIGVLMQYGADNTDGRRRVAVFVEALRQLGWVDGANAHIDVRWAAESIELEQQGAAELLALKPDVVLSSGTLSTMALQHATRSVPVVFVGVADPLSAGFVDTLARPGGNTTGFMNYEYSFAGKWLELLKRLAPEVTRVGVLGDVGTPVGAAQFGVIQVVGGTMGIEVRSIKTHDTGEMERAIAALAQAPNGGLVTIFGVENLHRDFLVDAAARYKLPAMYLLRSTVAAGGLAAYGPDRAEEFRQAAGYVDHILKGGKPGDLPVQAPTRFNLVINLKTAKALGLTVPPALLAAAAELIE